MTSSTAKSSRRGWRNLPACCCKLYITGHYDFRKEREEDDVGADGSGEEMVGNGGNGRFRSFRRLKFRAIS